MPLSFTITLNWRFESKSIDSGASPNKQFPHDESHNFEEQFLKFSIDQVQSKKSGGCWCTCVLTIYLFGSCTYVSFKYAQSIASFRNWIPIILPIIH